MCFISSLNSNRIVSNNSSKNYNTCCRQITMTESDTKKTRTRQIFAWNIGLTMSFGPSATLNDHYFSLMMKILQCKECRIRQIYNKLAREEFQSFRNSSKVNRLQSTFHSLTRLSTACLLGLEANLRDNIERHANRRKFPYYTIPHSTQVIFLIEPDCSSTPKPVFIHRQSFAQQISKLYLSWCCSSHPNDLLARFYDPSNENRLFHVFHPYGFPKIFNLFEEVEEEESDLSDSASDHRILLKLHCSISNERDSHLKLTNEINSPISADSFSLQIDLSTADEFLNLACSSDTPNLSSVQLFNIRESDRLIQANQRWNISCENKLPEVKKKKLKKVAFAEKNGKVSETIRWLIAHEKARKILRQDRHWEICARHRGITKFQRALMNGFTDFDECASSEDEDNQTKVVDSIFNHQNGHKRKRRHRKRKNAALRHKDSIVIASTTNPFLLSLDTIS